MLFSKEEGHTGGTKCTTRSGETGRKAPLGRPGCRWKDDIKTDLKEKEHDGTDWIYLAQDRCRWPVVVEKVTE